jgi:hypothetical protein
LRAYLSEAENVINEEKHILSFRITEMLSNSQTSQSNTSTSTRGLIHLPVHKSTLALTLQQKLPCKENSPNTYELQQYFENICIIYLLVIKLNDTTLNHFPVQVITLTSTFSNTSKDRETT